MIPHVWLLRETTEEYRRAKRARGQCITYRCLRVPGASRQRCYTCLKRLHRLQNPHIYAFNNLRDSARQRGIAFTLTFEEFLSFDARTNYVARRGRGDTDLSVDRIRSKEGYHAGNIRAMQYLDNCSHRYEDASAPAEF